MKISVVSPVYMAENIIEELVKRLSSVLQKITDNFEIILVDDCGPDKSWDKIQAQSSLYPFVKGIKLSKNFGQHSAIKAGLDIASGDCCIVIDCDLQQNPNYIPKLIEKWQQGNEIVFTYKKKRKHSFFKNISAYFFNKILNYLTDANGHEKADSNVGAYSLISKKVIEAFKKYNDYQFHYLMVLRWLGFQCDYIEIEHEDRFEGKSSYTLKKLLNHAMVGILYHSDKLLKMSIYFGVLTSILSVISIILVVIKYFISGFQSGWASLFVLISFFSGIILIAIGVLGLYIGKIFEQVKNRPQYIVDKKLNL